MTKLSAKSAATSTIINNNKGSLLLHVVKPGSPNLSYKVVDNKILQQVFDDEAARDLAVPGFWGQLGVQRDTKAVYASTGIATEEWAYVSGSGTYTPVLSDTSGLGSCTPRKAKWMRVGNIVTVRGEISPMNISSSSPSFKMSLPIASIFSEAYSCSGFIQSISATVQSVGMFYSAAAGTTALVTMNCSSSSFAVTHIFSFSYEVEA